MSTDKLLMDDYKRRMGFPNTTHPTAVRAIASKFGTSSKRVKEAIARLSPADSSDAVNYKIQAGRYKGMRKVIVNIRNEVVTWHTTANDQEIEDKIQKLRDRLISDV